MFHVQSPILTSGVYIMNNTSKEDYWRYDITQTKVVKCKFVK